MGRLLCSLELLRLASLYGEVPLSSPTNLSHHKGIYKCSCQLTGVIAALLKFSFFHLFFNHKLPMPCCSGMAWYWDDVFGRTQEKTNRLRVTFIVQLSPVLCRQHLDKNWNRKRLLQLEAQPLTTIYQEGLRLADLVTLGFDKHSPSWSPSLVRSSPQFY